MITSNVRVLIAKKEQAERRRLPYHVLSEETGIAMSSLVMLMGNKSKMIGFRTLDRLCNYFDVDPGEVLLWTPGEEAQS